MDRQRILTVQRTGRLTLSQLAKAGHVAKAGKRILGLAAAEQKKLAHLAEELTFVATPLVTCTCILTKPEDDPQDILHLPTQTLERQWVTTFFWP
jgi:hypothetical protein